MGDLEPVSADHTVPIFSMAPVVDEMQYESRPAQCLCSLNEIGTGHFRVSGPCDPTPFRMPQIRREAHAVVHGWLLAAELSGWSRTGP